MYLKIVQGEYVGDTIGFCYQDPGHALRLCHTGMGMSKHICGMQQNT